VIHINLTLNILINEMEYMHNYELAEGTTGCHAAKKLYSI